MKPKRIRANAILEDFRTGSSQPALVDANDGKRYVVKWKCTGEGPAALATDWITLRLAKAAGIPIPHSSCILVEPSLGSTTRNGELRDVIHRSMGINLAIEYLPESTVYTVNDKQEVEESLRRRIFLFDLLMVNVDRIDSNPNMLISKGKLYCIDFSASMAVKSLITGNSVSESALLPIIRRHPFYAPGTSPESFEIASAQVDKIVKSVPEGWLKELGTDTPSIWSRIMNGLTGMFVDSSVILEKRLKTLSSLTLESREEFHSRTRRNRESFEAAMKKWGYERKL